MNYKIYLSLTKSKLQLAQLVERKIMDFEVIGSIPIL